MFCLFPVLNKKESQTCGFKLLDLYMVFLRKNQVYEFIPARLPEFPIKKFEKVSGEAFFIDESLLVLKFWFNTEI